MEARINFQAASGLKGLPLLIINLLVFLSSTPVLEQSRDLHCLELFAGHGMVARRFRFVDDCVHPHHENKGFGRLESPPCPK